MTNKLMRLAAAASLLMLSTFASTAFSTENLKTTAEKSLFQKTGRYQEVQDLCQRFASQYPHAVRCTQFGVTPQGRPMMAIVASQTGALTPVHAKKQGVPVLLIQAGIHAGEIDGKDAGFLALREVLENQAAQGSLSKQVLVFVPVFNVDGHERFEAWNRPNQRGPEAMGWRTTAQNFNLNRDYLKADAPEMQAMLKLVNTWDPIAMIDLHVTDGAKFEHDISIQVEPALADDHPLSSAGREFQAAVIAKLTTQGSLPLDFYMAFEEEDNPLSGFANNVSPARFSTGYFQLRNRFAMLVETHSWKEYPTRVRITRNTIISALEQIAQHGKKWQALALQADKSSAKLGGKAIALNYKNTAQTKDIDFRGYVFTRNHSDVSGASMTRYDENQPEIWKVKLRDQVEADISATLPQAGYIVPPEHALRVAEKLRQHQITFQVLGASQNQVDIEVFQTSKATFGAQSIESHHMLKLDGTWKKAQAPLLAGSLFIPIAQAKVKLVAAMFEPHANDALVNWGWFNNAFEKKEYMEAYVAEEYAREQLTSNPALKLDFENKLARDANFAKNPAARLEYFARLHPSWDRNYQRYPIVRIDQAPVSLKKPF